MKKIIIFLISTIILGLNVIAIIFGQNQDWLDKYSDLSNKTTAELRLLRNEIYARHGRFFKSADLKKYFSNQS